MVLETQAGTGRSLHDIMNGLLRVDGVTSCLIVGRDGFVIDSATSEQIDAEGLGVMVATAIGTTEVLGQESNIGGLTQYMAEYESGNLFIVAIGDDILCVQSKPKVVIGAIRHAIRKSLKDLTQVL